MNGCDEPTMRLEFRSENPIYWGHLTLKTPMNNYFYSTRALVGDIILQSDYNANDLLLATLNKGKAIKFTTTPDLEGNQPDIERFRISSSAYHTLVDIKRQQVGEQNIGNALLRFLITQPTGEPYPELGHNWKIGIDGNSDKSFKIGANTLSGPFTNSFYVDNTAITIRPNNTLIIGNPTSGILSNNNFKAAIVSEDETNLIPFWVRFHPTEAWKYSMVNHIVGDNTNIVHNTVALSIANSFNQIGWRGVFEVMGNGDTRIDGKVTISDGSGEYKRQQDHLDARLFVEGKVVAKEIYVTIDNWADFVFNEIYSLPTIEYLEAFIKVNGHLPDIPKETEIMKNGMNLGEMQVKLLQKIEELTLYIIELKKEINQLKK